MKIRFLGTGTSSGVPEIGCTCPVCSSSDSHDKRLRASVIVEIKGARILIDCGPDFRQQILNIPHAPIDAVLLTHEHYDHLGGLDDLRPFCKDKVIPIYCLPRVADEIRKKMSYAFMSPTAPWVPHFDLIEVQPGVSFNIVCNSQNGSLVKIIPFEVQHGRLPILAYRIANMAYITDMKLMPQESADNLKGLDLLIVNALRQRTHPTHQSLDEAISLARFYKVPKVRFIHMAHTIGFHQKVNDSLPSHIQLAYDGEQLELDT